MNLHFLAFLAFCVSNGHVIGNHALLTVHTVQQAAHLTNFAGTSREVIWNANLMQQGNFINPQKATRCQIWSQPSFFFRCLFLCILQWHKPSWLCHDKFPLGRHSGFVLLAITVFLKYRFSLPGVRFDPRWPCACCFSIFSFVHFCGDNVL